MTTGCLNSDDCRADERCDFVHICVDIICPVPPLVGAIFQLSQNSNKLGASGTIVCARGYIYKTNR